MYNGSYGIIKERPMTLFDVIFQDDMVEKGTSTAIVCTVLLTACQLNTENPQESTRILGTGR